MPKTITFECSDQMYAMFEARSKQTGTPIGDLVPEFLSKLLDNILALEATNKKLGKDLARVSKTCREVLDMKADDLVYLQPATSGTITQATGEKVKTTAKKPLLVEPGTTIVLDGNGGFSSKWTKQNTPESPKSH